MLEALALKIIETAGEKAVAILATSIEKKNDQLRKSKDRPSISGRLTVGRQGLSGAVNEHLQYIKLGPVTSHSLISKPKKAC